MERFLDNKGIEDMMNRNGDTWTSWINGATAGANSGNTVVWEDDNCEFCIANCRRRTTQENAMSSMCEDLMGHLADFHLEEALRMILKPGEDDWTSKMEVGLEVSGYASRRVEEHESWSQFAGYTIAATACALSGNEGAADAGILAAFGSDLEKRAGCKGVMEAIQFAVEEDQCPGLTFHAEDELVSIDESTAMLISPSLLNTLSTVVLSAGMTVLKLFGRCRRHAVGALPATCLA